MKSFIYRLLSLSLIIGIILGRPAIAEDTQQPPQQPQQQPQDRKDGAGAAQALAIVGAAMAGLGCAELLRQAAQTQDPSEKAQLRAMAMQQCSQAAQSAANAAKNGEGKEQMSSNNSPTGSQLNNNNKTAETPKEQKNETPQLPNFANNETAQTPETPSEVADTNNTEPVQPQTFDQAPATADSGYTPTQDYSASANSISTLQPIPKATVQYDEGNKSQTAADTKNPNAVSSSGFSNSGLSAEALKKLAEQKAEGEADKKKKKNNGTESGEGSSGDHGHDSASGGSGSGGGTASGSAEDQGFSAMLSSLLNPGAGAPAGLAAGGGGAFATGFGGEDGKNRAPNIFEYASYRYRKLSHETLVGKGVIQRMTASTKERN